MWPISENVLKDLLCIEMKHNSGLVFDLHLLLCNNGCKYLCNSYNNLGNVFIYFAVTTFYKPSSL